MRQLVAVIVVAACKKEEPAHAPLPPPPSSVVAHADAGAADAALADAGAPLVDLLRAVPITITVSSTVVNPAIVPAHLVDRDLGTAWNSATGELVGAWIEATLPSGARAAEIRMTVGHTGHGKHGEDYFTMNPRIKGVSVWSGDTLLGNVKLDVSNRALQTIAARATGSVRVEVLEIVPGSKPGWRETCVSELEIWGTPPAGWTPPKTRVVPTVVVQPPPPPPPPASDPCAWLAEATAERTKSDAATAAACAHATGEGAEYCGLDMPGSPSCWTTVTTLALAAPWHGDATATCYTHDRHYGEGTCDVAIGDASFQIVSTHPTLDIEKVAATVQDVIPGGETELVVRLAASWASYVVVCRAAPAGCSEPVTVEDPAAPVRVVAGGLVVEDKPLVFK